MQKNDYRRALIMLRSTSGGLSGHVRLEKRTLMGSMCFTVTGQRGEGELQAALLAIRGGRRTGVRLGALGPPRYGQSGLVYNFDPRNIQGLPLEDYDLIAVVQIENGVCQLVLVGFLNGSFEADMALARETACLLYAPVEISVQPVTLLDERPEEDAPVFSADVPASEPPVNTAPAPAASEIPVDEFDTPAAAPETPTEAFDTPAAAPETPTEAFDTPAVPSQTESAAQSMGLDTKSAWPHLIEPLRALFAQPPEKAPFPAEGFTFVRAPLPEGGGIPYCLAGLSCENGVPRRVLYAIPSPFTPEPPAGLDGYVWRGGAVQGYWAICQDVENGQWLSMD